MSDFEESINKHIEEKPKRDAKEWFSKLIQEDQYVGDLYSTNYEQSKVLVHDSYREKVGGIPSLCFLIATRVNLQEDIDYKSEDSSIILLRVMDSTAIPQDRDVEKVRVQTAQRVSGITEKNWDDKDFMDEKTRSVFGFAGIACRVVGTYFLEENTKTGNLELKFGTDLSNFYSNMALKVYKPKSEALDVLVNYIDPQNLQNHKNEFGNAEAVKLGVVRYASTNRQGQGVDNVPTYIFPADLLAQKSALFGMTRTGKSNTTKIIAKSVYELRYPQIPSNTPLSIGQLILDPNGEYANENVQDKDGNDNPSALKNIWESHSKNKSDEDREKQIATYGIRRHKKDPYRKLMLLNFYKDENLQLGKEILDSILEEDKSKYLKNFAQIRFDPPELSDRSASVRYNRRVLAYRTLLFKAGFPLMNNFDPHCKGLFGSKLIEYLEKDESSNASKYNSVAEVLKKKSKTWQNMISIFEGLSQYTNDSKSNYNDFEREYVKESSSGDNWADDALRKILTMFDYPNGSRLIGKAIPQHSPDTNSDYAEDIYNDLKDGKLVIIDQSSGEPELNKSSADRIMWHIFRKNQSEFREGENKIPHILIYIEEAHNLLPSGKDLDLSDVWVRTAKEGAKYNLGLVYATQEVSSIQKNILRNTANWFISHLNNTDETKELTKYYDFIDFEPSIRRAQDKGFLRVKTLSSPFIVPMQIDKFETQINE